LCNTFLIICTLFEHLINRKFIHQPVRTVGETATVTGPLPNIHIPEFNWTRSNIVVILQYGAFLAVIGLVESIMTLQAVNSITGDHYNDYKNNKECIAQGIGNFVSGIFGSMGGSAMIGQSTINAMNGARHRLSGILASFTIFLFIQVAGSIIDLIPVAALTGVLFMVVISTFEWYSLPHYYWKVALYLIKPKQKIKVPWLKVTVMTLVTLLAVLGNLAIGVVVGVSLESLVFAYENLSLFHKKDVEHTFDDLFHEEVKPEGETEMPIIYQHL